MNGFLSFVFPAGVTGAPAKLRSQSQKYLACAASRPSTPAAGSSSEDPQEGFRRAIRIEEERRELLHPTESTMSHKLLKRDPETGLLPRDRFVYVDEQECIGCTLCSTTAENTFFMEEDYGRARAFRQDGDSVDRVEQAIDTCPVNCIWYVSMDDLVTLENERVNQKIDNFKRLVGGSTPRVQDSKSKVMKSKKMRCENCPNRGCKECPLFGVGENPAYLALVEARRQKQAAKKKRGKTNRKSL